MITVDPLILWICCPQWQYFLFSGGQCHNLLPSVSIHQLRPLRRPNKFCHGIDEFGLISLSASKGGLRNPQNSSQLPPHESVQFALIGRHQSCYVFLKQHLYCGYSTLTGRSWGCLVSLAPPPARGALGPLEVEAPEEHLAVEVDSWQTQARAGRAGGSRAAAQRPACPGSTCPAPAPPASPPALAGWPPSPGAVGRGALRARTVESRLLFRSRRLCLSSRPRGWRPRR